jgi:hypothetical protein
MLNSESTKVMAAAKARRVFAWRVNCNAIGVPGIAASSKMPNTGVGCQREDADQQETYGRYQDAIRQQGADKQGALAQDIK